MKVEVEIPDGKYCDSCVFAHRNVCVVLFDEILHSNEKKLSNCPSLKEHTVDLPENKKP